MKFRITTSARSWKSLAPERQSCSTCTRDSGTTHLEFKIPSRGIMGYRSEFLTDTNGNGIMNHVFDCYEPYKGDIQQRSTGSLVVHETGESTAYGLFYAQDRGRLFIGRAYRFTRA